MVDEAASLRNHCGRGNLDFLSPDEKVVFDIVDRSGGHDISGFYAIGEENDPKIFKDEPAITNTPNFPSGDGRRRLTILTSWSAMERVAPGFTNWGNL